MLAAAPFYATTCGGIIRAELKKVDNGKMMAIMKITLTNMKL